MSDYKFKYMDAPDYKDPGAKKSSFKLKLILTLAIIGMLFVLFTKDEVRDKIHTAVADRAVGQQFGADANVTGTKFDRANMVQDRAALEAMAQEEAGRMIQTGDVDEYKRALSNHKILKSVAE